MLRAASHVLCSPKPSSLARRASEAWRKRLAPALGWVLVGAACPAFATTTQDDAPPLPRLKLAQAIASLTPPADLQVSGEAPSSLSNASDATQGLLRLNLSRQLSLGTIPGARPVANAASAPLPAPTPDKQPSPPNTPAPPPGRRDQAAVVARDEQAPSARNSKDSEIGKGDKGGTPPSPAQISAASAGADAQVVGNDEFLPAEEEEIPLPTLAPRPAPGTPTETPKEGGTGERKRGWGLAPIRWGGSLSTGLRTSTSGESTRSTSQVYEGRLRVNSYIWQPYIALTSGDFALTTVRSQDGGEASSNNLVGTSVSGTGSLNLFPQSRFPFSASVSLSDSRSDGSFANTNIARRRLSLRQDYRPVRGSWAASGSYDRSELSGGDFGSDIVDRISGNYSEQFTDQTLSATGDISNNRARDTSVSDFYTSISHGYRYSDALTFNTTASLTGQQFQADAGNTHFSGKARSAQVFSYASWAPIESKLRGAATIRYFQTESRVGSSELDNQSLGGSANLSYQATQNLSMSGSLGANFDKDGQASTNQSVGLSYSGDPLRFGEYDYSWNTSTSASNSTSPNGNSAQSLGVSAGHSLTRYWRLTEETSVSGSLNQSVSNTRSTGTGSASSTSMSHGAGVSMQARSGDALSGFLSLSLSDNRSLGGVGGSFQMLNAQLSGQWRIDAYSSVDSNLTWQMTRQESGAATTIVITDEFGRPILIDESLRTSNSSLTGGLGYSHSRFFGVRGLRYRLNFQANTNRDDSRRFGNPDADRPGERASLDLDQRLMFRIGRLDTELQYRIAEIQGSRNQLLYFRVSRDFGAF